MTEFPRELSSAWVAARLVSGDGTRPRLALDLHQIVAHAGGNAVGLLHYWIPAFNEAFSKRQLGLLMLQEVVWHLPELGCHTIDFGPGGERYKQQFGKAVLAGKQGFIERSTLRVWMRRARRAAGRVVRGNSGARRAAGMLCKVAGMAHVQSGQWRA